MTEHALLSAYPTVYAVGEDYQIVVPVTEETVMWVGVGGKNYYSVVLYGVSLEKTA